MEGTWKTWYDKTVVKHLPWAPSRPYIGGTTFNCLSVQIKLDENKAQSVQVEEVQVVDEECNKRFCPLCKVRRPILEVKLRGLCPEIDFDRTYIYNIGKNGKPIYRGLVTSIISYNQDQSVWVWYARKPGL